MYLTDFADFSPTQTLTWLRQNIEYGAMLCEKQGSTYWEVCRFYSELVEDLGEVGPQLSLQLQTV